MILKISWRIKVQIITKSVYLFINLTIGAEHISSQLQNQIENERMDRLQQRSNSYDPTQKSNNKQKESFDLFKTQDKRISYLKQNTISNKKNICNSCYKKFHDNNHLTSHELPSNSNNKINNSGGNEFSKHYGGLLSELIIEDINLYSDKCSKLSQHQMNQINQQKQSYKNHIDKFNFRLKKKKQVIERISANKNSMSVPTDDNQGLYSSQGLTKSASVSHQEISLNEFNETSHAQNEDQCKTQSNKHYRQILDKFKSELLYEHSIKNRLQKISEVYVSDFSSYADNNLNNLQKNDQSLESIIMDHKPEIRNKQMKVILMLIYVLIKHPQCLKLLITKLFKGIDFKNNSQIPKNFLKFNLNPQQINQNNNQFQIQTFIFKYIKYIIYYFIFQIFSSTFSI